MAVGGEGGFGIAKSLVTPRRGVQGRHWRVEWRAGNREGSEGRHTPAAREERGTGVYARECSGAFGSVGWEVDW